MTLAAYRPPTSPTPSTSTSPTSVRHRSAYGPHS
jgi:hypothetical protein